MSLLKALYLALLATTTTAAAVRPANQAPLLPSPAQAAQITSAPSLANSNTNAGCAGLIVTDDLSMPEPYCCVGGVYAVAPFALTKWDYAHTGADLPSTVITPTTCVRPVPLTAVPTVA